MPPLLLTNNRRRLLALFRPAGKRVELTTLSSTQALTDEWPRLGCTPQSRFQSVAKPCGVANYGCPCSFERRYPFLRVRLSSNRERSGVPHDPPRGLGDTGDQGNDGPTIKPSAPPACNQVVVTLTYFGDSVREWYSRILVRRRQVSPL